MKIWSFPAVLFLAAYLLLIGAGAGAEPVADWAYQKPYSLTDLVGKNETPIGYQIIAPVSAPDESARVTGENETIWSFDMGKAGTFVLEYIPSPVISREDEYFQIHERDVSFLDLPFHEENLYYDGSVYSCWGNAGDTKIRYDGARFIDGHFFKLTCIFNTVDEALRYNQKIREIITTITRSSSGVHST